MKELVNHPAYKVIREYHQKGVVLDYFILQDENESINNLEGHKKAAIAAMKILAKERTYMNIEYDESKMCAEKYSVEQFFALPEDPYYIDKPDVKSRAWYTNNDEAYAYAFLETPYGNDYVIKDFERFNSILFPNKDGLTIYQWNTEWSNYFEEGLEWWGAYYWTIYDSSSGLFIVVGASTTD